jgi:hypothetical protein
MTPVALRVGRIEHQAVIIGGEHGGEDAPQVRLLHRKVGPRCSRTAPPRWLACGRLQRSGSHEGGIVEAAKEDYGKLIEAKAESLGLREEGGRMRSA